MSIAFPPPNKKSSVVTLNDLPLNLTTLVFIAHLETMAMNPKESIKIPIDLRIFKKRLIEQLMKEGLLK